MQPLRNDADAARAAILPLDCPDDVIQSLFDPQPQRVISNNDVFQEYITAAYDHDGTAPTAIDIEITPYQIAVFPGLAALRLHAADPLTGTKYDEQEPDGSAESRMLQTPLRKHPGLTIFTRCARKYYVATLQSFFKHSLPPSIQIEFIAALFAKTPAGSAHPQPRIYADRDPKSLYQDYADDITIDDDSIQIHDDLRSRACQLRPRYETFIANEDTDVPRPTIDRGSVTIPWKVFRFKLAEYAWRGWAKLVHTAYNTLTELERQAFITETPGTETTLFSKYKLNNPIYRPKYAVDSKNPEQEWDEDSQQYEYYPLEDKRLITAVDCIRASPDLTFNDYLPVQTLYNELRRYFPPPRRPGNDISDIETLKSALANTERSTTKYEEDDETGRAYCKLPKPVDTPIFQSTLGNYWDTYHRQHAALRAKTPRIREEAAYNRPDRYIKPILTRHQTKRFSDRYDAHKAKAQAIAAQAQSTIGTLQDVDAAVSHKSNQSLTDDEITFLYRVAFAMERQIDDYSLTTSMRALRHRPDGTELKINKTKLENNDLLETHDEGRAVLHTVPAKIRKALGVNNISHDGYGEKTPREKSLHRKGIDLAAAHFAAKPDVTRVVRYCDLWRLHNTPAEEPLKENGLLSTRIDVIAFHEDTPKYVAEVETQSNDNERTQRCLEKLTTLNTTDAIHTTLITPNPDHLDHIMNQLHRTDTLQFDSFPTSTKHYTRTTWKTELQKENIINTHFDELHTYSSLQQHTPDDPNHTTLQKVIGNI